VCFSKAFETVPVGIVETGDASGGFMVSNQEQAGHLVKPCGPHQLIKRFGPSVKEAQWSPVTAATVYGLL